MFHRQPTELSCFMLTNINICYICFCIATNSSVPQSSRSTDSTIQQKYDFTGGLDNSIPSIDKPIQHDSMHTDNEQQSQLLPPAGSTALSKGQRRVIIVAKQLPITLRKDTVTGEWSCKWDDPRSFLSNLRVLRNKMEVVWVGWPGIYVEKHEQDAIEELLELEGCVPVFLSRELGERCFNGFCRGVLWPLFHYTLPSAVIDFATSFDASWQAYTAANTLYATQVSHTVESSQDWIWVHNYHLLLVPGFVRNKLPRARIGLFLHTPFPSSDVFRLLPTRTNMLTAIMAADLIGFHTFDYARHFLSALKRVMDLDFESLPGGRLGIKYSGRFVSIIINHVGVDASFFSEQARSDRVKQLVAQYKQQYGNKKIIVSVDDLDLVKGSLLKIQAYDRFLDRFNDMKENVVMIQVIGKSGSSESEQLFVSNALTNVFNQIKQKHGDSVIEIKHKESVDLDQLVALYAVGDVAVVSTFWDGLNLVPFEYTAAQSDADPGSLIVSEFMGCSRSLNGVSRVNPWNLDNVVDALHHSLTMSLDERKANHSRRSTYVMNHNVERWSLSFLDALELASKQGASLSYVQVGWGSNVRLLGVRSDFMHLDEGQIAVAYRKCYKRILLLDYDGTLNAPEKSAQRSKLVTPSNTVMQILKLLTADLDNYVFIMSGRTRDCLHEWFSSLPELGVAAEKGCFLKWPARMQHSRKQIKYTKHSSPQRKHKSNISESHSPRSDTSKLGIIQEDANSTDTSPAHSQLLSNDNITNDETSISCQSGSYLSNHHDGSSDDIHVDWVSDHDSDSDEFDDQWESLVPLDDIAWKQVALDLIKSYTESVDGSWIEDKEFAIVWHYEQADPEYGRMQASELHKYLIKVINNPAVDVLKYDYNRILEVKPKGINKGVAATVIMEALITNVSPTTPYQSSRMVTNQTNPRSPGISPSLSPSVTMISPTLSPSHSNLIEMNEPFILAVGDDRSDEDMFASVHNRDNIVNKRDAAAQAAKHHTRKYHSSRPSSSTQHVHFADQPVSPTDSNTSSHVSTLTLKEEQVSVQGSSVDSVNNNSGTKLLRSVSEPQWSSQPGMNDRQSSHTSSNTQENGEFGASNKKPSHPYTFTVCVGMKPSKAHYYLHDDKQDNRHTNPLTPNSQLQTKSFDSMNDDNIA